MFDAGTVTATLDLDRSPFITSLEAGRREGGRFAREGFKATLGADVRGLQQNLRAARQELSSFAGEIYQAILGADSSGVRRDINLAEALLSRFDRQTYAATLGVRGSAQTIAELKAAGIAAERVDGQSVDIDVDTDASAIRSVSDSFKGLASNIRATGTILAAASIPFAIAAIGAGIPTVLSLAASFGGLATALGSGLVGAAVAATGALGALGGALALVAAPVSMLIGKLKESETQTEALAAAQKSLESASQAYGDARRSEVQAEQNLIRVRREGRRAIDEQREALQRVEAEGTAEIQAQERALTETRRQGALDVEAQEEQLEQTRIDAGRAIEAQEQRLSATRRQAIQSNAQAEVSLESARETLTSATRSLTAAQNELNRAERNEPLIQAQLTLDLADARDRLSDATRSRIEAEYEFGRGSEEATDAIREEKRAELDLELLRRDVSRQRRNRSDEFNAARDAAAQARREEKQAGEEANAQERTLIQTRREGRRLIEAERSLLVQTRNDEARAIREQVETTRQARGQAHRDEEEQLRQLREIRKENLQQEEDALDALNDARRQARQQESDAQRQLTDQMRATARAFAALADAHKEIRKIREETVKLTPAQRALQTAYERFGNKADRAFGDAQDSAARLGVEILKFADNYLPRLGRTSDRVVGAVSDVFDTFRSEITQPVENAGITRYLAALPGMTRTAGNAAVNLGIALFNVFTRSLGPGRKLLRGIEDLSETFLEWTRSVRGQNAIDSFFRSSMRRAQQFLGIIKDLGRGVGNVFQSINEAGLDDQAVRGLEDFAAGFARITTKGTESRAALDRFVRHARDLMPFVGRAVGSVAREIGNLSSQIIGARQKGHRLTILQEIFKGIADAARPLRRLVVDTFKDLGPEIARLIPAVARFLGIFAGSNGPLVIFVRSIRRAVEWFNELPGPIKRAAGWLLTMKLVLGGLGITALVRPLARFAANMLLVNSASRAVGGASALPAVVGSIARLGTLLGVGVGLAALAGAFYLVYRRNKLVREAVNNLVDRLKNHLKPEIGRVQDAWKNFGKGVAARIDDLGDVIVDVFDLRRKNRERKLKQLGKNAAVDFGLGIHSHARSLDKDGSPGDELAQKIAIQLSNGLRAWLTRKGSDKRGLTGFSVGKWISLIVPTNFGLAVGQWFGKEVGPEFIEHAPWGAIKKSFRDNIIRAITLGGLIPYLTRQTNKHIVKPIGDAIRRAGWGGMGRDAAWGIIKGFTGVDMGSWFGKKVRDAIEWVKRDNEGHSPWGSTEILGRDAALGWVRGIERNAPAMVQAARDSVKRAIGGMKEHNLLDVGASSDFPGGQPPRSLLRRAARTEASPGGAAITVREIAEIMRRTFGQRREPARPRTLRDQAPRAGRPLQHPQSRQRSSAGRAMTASEFQQISRRNIRDMARLMQAGMSDAPNLRAFEKSMDNSLGGFLAFRRGMRTEPQ